jgi:predicted phage baseplate assembly protein
MAPPALDARILDHVVRLLARRGRELAPEWDPLAPGDPGAVLGVVFAHFHELVLERLNRVPDKNLLAFLDLLGVGLLPPGPAAAPAVFTLAPTAGASGFVPGGTQVATVQSETRPAVVYETRDDLSVLAARLVAGFTVDPGRDRFGDRTGTVAGQERASFLPFQGDRPVDHVLYLGADPLLLAQRAARLILAFRFAEPIDQAQLQALFGAVAWEARRAGAWQPLPAPTLGAGGDPTASRILVIFEPGQGGGFAGADLDELPGPGLPAPLRSRWIRGRLAQPITRFLTAELATVVGVAPAEGVAAIRPGLRLAHPAGEPVTKLSVPPLPQWTLSRAVDAGAETLPVGAAEDLRRGDALVVLDEPTEFVTVTSVPAATGPTTVTIALPLRFGHEAGVPLRRVVLPRPAATTALVAAVPAGGAELPLASTADLGTGDVVEVGSSVVEKLVVDDVATLIQQATVQGIAPDQVHVDTTPVDFTREFHPLGPNPTVGATFHLASTEALAKVAPEGADPVLVNLLVKADDAKLEWEYLGPEGRWKQLQLEEDTTDRFRGDGRISFILPDDIQPLENFPGAERAPFVIRVSILAGGYQNVPVISAIALFNPFEGGQFDEFPFGFTSDYRIDQLLVVLKTGRRPRLNPGLLRVDLDELFLPFGPAPEPGRTFFLGLEPDREPFRKLIHVEVVPRSTVELAWEYSTAAGWRALAVEDGTQAFTQPGAVSFPRPRDVAPAEVNGVVNHWLRARLVRGGYGRPPEFVPVAHLDLAKGFRLRAGTGPSNAPVVHAVSLNYTARDPDPLVVTHNQFQLADRTADNRDRAAGWRMFEAVEEQQPTFYLAFDRALPNEAVTVYVTGPPRRFVERPPAGPASAPGGEEAEGDTTLAWEYWDGGGWAELPVVDGTRSLTEPGTVQFLGPAGMAALARFDDRPRYWIRARLLQGGADALLVDGVFLNAVEVVQATTTPTELLGSSNGGRHQVFRFSRRPVLPGQRILVGEPERPPADELRAIEAEEGPDAVRREAAGGTGPVWVRWHEVRSLAGSGPRGRHYTIDRITGEVRFGDGVHGLIPPQGSDNLVCDGYRAGGGPSGNQPAGALSQLKSSIPYVAAVTNPVPADGGSEAEPLQAVRERGPQVLRHRGRAVTVEDLEWLARQAAGTRVARARCLPNRNRELAFEPGWATVIVVPEGTERRLLPSPALVHEVQEHLVAGALATLAGATPVRLNVIGPGYVPVEVAAEVMPVALPRADAVRRAVLAALDAFLHPLTGGPDGTGWAFGRDVHLSELFAAFEAVPGVEHVHSLRLKPTVATLPLTLETGDGAPAPVAAAGYRAGATLTTADQAVAGTLAEPIPTGAPVTSAMVELFREGERVRVGTGEEAVEATVRSISAGALTVEPFRAPAACPPGTPVASVTGPSRSVLTVVLAAGALATQLDVRGFVADEQVTLANPDGSGPLTLALGGAGEGARRRLALGERLRVPEFYLACSGAHTVDITQD